MELPVGYEVDGRYVISAELGAGGIARVYVAQDRRLEVPVAIKVLMVPIASGRERLRREGLAQASLTHAHIVRVSDIVPVGPSVGLVMELVRGPTLTELISSRLLSGPERLAIARQITRGVQAAHAHGLIHRDLKPANVMVHATGTELIAKVADFGLVKFVGSESDNSVTRTGTTMGSPQYMSPEQIRDASRVDHRTDLFSLGGVLYELFCDVPPFEGVDTFDLFQKVVNCEFKPPGEVVQLPEFIDHAIRACLVADPEQRVQSCGDLLEILGRTSPPDVWTPETLAWVASYAQTMDRSQAWGVHAQTWADQSGAFAGSDSGDGSGPHMLNPNPPPQPYQRQQSMPPQHLAPQHFVPAQSQHYAPTTSLPPAGTPAPKRREMLPPPPMATSHPPEPDARDVMTDADLHHPLFKGANEPAIHAALDQLNPVEVPAGSMLMEDGEHDPSVLLVLGGTLEYKRQSVVVGKAGPGDLVGGLDMLTDSPRQVTVATTSGLLAVVLHRLGYRALSSASNIVAANCEVEVVRHSAAWLHSMQARIIELEPTGVPGPRGLATGGLFGMLRGMFSSRAEPQATKLTASAVFSALPSFSQVKPHIVTAVANSFKAVRIEPGTLVHRPTEPEKYLYIHASGDLGLGVHLGNGRVLELPRPIPGDILSLTGLVDGDMADQTVAWAKDPVELLRTPLEDLRPTLVGDGNVPALLRDLVIVSVHNRIEAVLGALVRLELERR